MDKQLDNAIINFYSDLRGKTTEELYKEYLVQCKAYGIEPRQKSVIVREACEITGCVIERKQIEIKYFVPKDENHREEWRRLYESKRISSADQKM